MMLTALLFASRMPSGAGDECTRQQTNWRRFFRGSAPPKPSAAGVLARRPRDPGGPRIVPRFREAPACANHAAPCPPTDLPVACTVWPTHKVCSSDCAARADDALGGM